jgi:hypothetical protein
VCVCVREQEREREKRGRENINLLLHSGLSEVELGFAKAEVLNARS